MPMTPPPAPADRPPSKPAEIPAPRASVPTHERMLAILTSGGDAPGMNAAIRAVVRSAESKGFGVFAARRGYWGLIDDNMQRLSCSDVRGIIQRGGTILETSRCKPFLTEEGRAQAAKNLRAKNVQGLIAIGGDGTFRGAELLSREQGIPVVAIPGTIDNDIYGTDYTIGYDTAVNTAMEAIDRIRDTAFSHERLFFVEVMGRNAGGLALDVAVAGGAEEVFIPETRSDLEKFLIEIKDAFDRGKRSFIAVVAEGDELGGAQEAADLVREDLHLDSRVSILGYIQRGGSPSARDRVLASRMGANAVKFLLAGKDRVMVAIQGEDIVAVPLAEVFENRKDINADMLDILNDLKG